MKIFDYNDEILNTWKQKSKIDDFVFSVNDPSIESIDFHFLFSIVINKPKKNKKSSGFKEIKDESLEEQKEPKSKNKKESPSFSPSRREKRLSSSSSSSKSSSPPRKRHKTSSPLNGLITHEEYTKNKEQMNSKRHDISHIDKSLTGENAPTIYRDKSGKKITNQTDVMSIALKSYNMRTEKEKNKEKLDWGLGKKQKEELIIKHKELEKAKKLPFAVHSDDIEYHAELKNKLREEDPMLKYEKEKKKIKSNKPIYKGPAPPKNRYNIMPGYRWDGVDRSNGFERRYLAAIGNRLQNKDEEYKYLTRDM